MWREGGRTDGRTRFFRFICRFFLLKMPVLHSLVLSIGSSMTCKTFIIILLALAFECTLHAHFTIFFGICSHYTRTLTDTYTHKHIHTLAPLLGQALKQSAQHTAPLIIALFKKEKKTTGFVVPSFPSRIKKRGTRNTLFE